MLMQSWKIVDFAKIWPLTSHNWVKYWPRTKKRTTNREYSSRAIRWFFPLSSTTLSFETRGGVASTPPPARPRYENRRARARVNSLGSHLSHKLIWINTAWDLHESWADSESIPWKATWVMSWSDSTLRDTAWVMSWFELISREDIWVESPKKVTRS